METTQETSAKASYEILAEYLLAKGIKQIWIAENMRPQKTKMWVTRILNGSIRLTDENKKQIETLLGITL